MKLFLIYLFAGVLQSGLLAQKPLVIREEKAWADERGLDGRVDNWTYVNLVLDGINPEGGQITMARYADPYVLLEGMAPEGKYFLLFDREGKFLTGLDHRNVAAERLHEVTKYGIDAFGKRIVLIQGWKQQVYWYDFSGNCLGGQKFEADGVISEFCYIDGTNVLCCNQVTGQGKTAYFTTADDFRSCKPLAAFTVSYRAGAMPFAHKAVAVNGGKATYLMPFCDTIFEYPGQKTAYLTATRQVMPEGFPFKPGTDYSVVYLQGREQGAEDREGVYETGRMLLLRYASGMQFYDKLSGRSVYVGREEKPYNSRMILPRDLIGEAPDAVVAAFTSGELKDMERQMQAEGMVPQGPLQEFLQSATEKNSVALIFYQLKTL